MIRTALACAAIAIAAGCASTQTVQHGDKAQFVSSKPPDAFLACVRANADAMNGVMLMLLFKAATAEDGSPRLIIDRPLNTFAVVDAKPSGAGTAATVHLGFAGLAPGHYVGSLTKGCA